jgi:RNA polymerase sigma-70 factor (ECF subfamily)
MEIEQDIASSQKIVIRESIRALENNDINKLFSQEIEDIVTRALATMPELASRVFAAHRYHGMSYSDIASANNISEIKVDTEMRRALKILRSALKDFICIVFPLI